jgi:outer membrane protein TolC
VKTLADWLATVKTQSTNPSLVSPTTTAQGPSRSINYAAAQSSEATITSTGARRLTLAQAKQQATTAENPMARLAQLQVEAAKQHRLGAQADYFPKIGTTFTNFHFNKFMGQVIPIVHPVQGIITTAGLPLAGKDQTFVAVTVAQPLTPLFKLHEVVNIARADERIARAKAGMSVSETAQNTEKNYYEVLIAQRQLAAAQASARQMESQSLIASNSGLPVELMSLKHKEKLSAIERTTEISASRVRELTASLNDLLGWPPDTELELVPPDPQFEEISLQQVTDQAMVANAEVVEAEQTVAKARAGVKLSKLDYIPDFAAIGGYAYNANALPLLPGDFSFVGVMGSYNLFDFGKREHTAKERSTQLAMAETGLQLTKAKVAASVKKSYYELERSRHLSELARRLSSTTQVEGISFQNDNWEVTASKAKIEAEMFQADLDYYQALAHLKILMGE